LNILFISDVFGQPGRDAPLRWLPGFRDERAADFVIANGENVGSGGGGGGGGVDVLTTGNHVWRQKEVYAFLATDGRAVRPAADGSEVAVINVDTQAPRAHRSASARDLRRAAAIRASDFRMGRILRNSLRSLGLVSWDRAPRIVFDQALEQWTVG